MPRPQLYPVKKVVGFDQEMLDAIEKWRATSGPCVGRWLEVVGQFRPG